MIKNQDIICISSIDWDFIWQGHQEIMSTLASHGNRILFIENTGVRAPGLKDFPRLKRRIKNYLKGVKGIRQELPNLYIFSPIIIPWPYSWIARKINKVLLLSVLNRWMKVMNFADPIIWTFLPNGISLDIIDAINKKLLIYYCIDDFSSSSPAAKKVKATEKKLLKLADLVFVTSRALFDYCSKYSSKVTIFPFGVNIERFEEARDAAQKRPIEISKINTPIIGYVGGIHKWIDQKLIRDLALNLPDYSFVFIGPIQTDISLLSNLKNIYFIGAKEHKDLPGFVKEFSCAIIPYTISDYTKNVYPTKLNEYLAMGKPVISTDLPEVNYFNERYKDIVYVAKDREEFTDFIKKSISQGDDLSIERRFKAARDNSWVNRIEQMSSIIQSTIEKKLSDSQASWGNSLLLLFRRAQRKFIKISLSIIFIYAMIFYTPFGWFLAKPLKIVQKPQSADAIVVFAGGVGESGRAGQGFEERVDHAVNLYKQGFAKNIIFSSGYMHTFKEPLVMKALAVSLGVPESAITLEDKASNTFENVKFTRDILKDRNWEKVILISSPYHMRRVYLVFKRISQETKVFYSPIPKSLFYSHKLRNEEGKIRLRRINVRQIKALLHEYFGIVYYKIKGYI